MLISTKAIILHYIPYKDTSLIVYAYSENNGRISLIANGVRKPKSKLKLNIFQPLSIVDIVYYSKGNNELCRIKEVKRNLVFSEIPYRIDKNSIATFIAEFIYKVIREEDKNEALFEFFYYSIQYLDKVTTNISIFNLIFLIQLTKYVGIKPNDNYSESNEYFNLNSGSFASIFNNGTCLNRGLSQILYKLLKCSYEQLDNLLIEKSNRKELLNKLLIYYKTHLDYNVTIKSLKILEEVFNS